MAGRLERAQLENGSDIDRALMEGFALHGSRTAYEALVRRWDDKLLAFLVKATGDSEAAKDLRQEVFLRVYRFGAGYDPRYAFTTWFFRIVRNVIIDWQKARARPAGNAGSGGCELESVRDARPHPRTQAERTEIVDTVNRALATFSVEERELLLLRLQFELSYREIGEVCGVPESTAKGRIYALLGRVREALETLHAEYIHDAG